MSQIVSSHHPSHNQPITITSTSAITKPQNHFPSRPLPAFLFISVDDYGDDYG